jgi:hypothetical protein
MLTAPAEDRELRAELQRITDTSGFNQQSDIAALCQKRPHSISFVAQSSEQPHGYNCFMYALGLVVLPEKLLALARQHDEAFPSERFVAHLVERGLQLVSAADAEDGDLVVYFGEGGTPKHAGIVQSGSVVSKWGTGHIWKHQAFEIPSSYGVEVRFYRRIDRDEVLRLFEAFADDVVGGQGGRAGRP